jgi:hypothetical protein
VDAVECWGADIEKAKPILTWKGRVGTGEVMRVGYVK